MKDLFYIYDAKPFRLKSLHRLYNHVILSLLWAFYACRVFPDL